MNIETKFIQENLSNYSDTQGLDPEQLEEIWQEV
ncbi:MAG: hypothetical protein J07AB43_11110 [Candidatus Nanosalina sp. J07AB43]|nr:MAG: hypothetical protein J07AB43_11110 [Candidatus Nanosalina sp. J07AB43]